MTTICITNQKGGVGKTTTAVNVATALSGYQNKSVLLIDFDTQCSAARAFGYEPGVGGESRIGDLLEMVEQGNKDLPFAKALLEVQIPNLYFLPGQKKLARYLPAHRPTLLAELLQILPNKPDFIIIDCPPSLSLMTTNAIFASDWAIVPCEHAVFSLDGLADLLAILEEFSRLKKDLNPSDFYRILLTKVNPNRKKSSEYISQELAPYRERLFNTVIRENDSLNQAHAAGAPIFYYDSPSNGAKDYFNLTQEIIAYEEARIQKIKLAQPA